MRVTSKETKRRVRVAKESQEVRGCEKEKCVSMKPKKPGWEGSVDRLESHDLVVEQLLQRLPRNVILLDCKDPQRSRDARGQILVRGKRRSHQERRKGEWRSETNSQSRRSRRRGEGRRARRPGRGTPRGTGARAPVRPSSSSSGQLHFTPNKRTHPPNDVSSTDFFWTREAKREGEEGEKRTRQRPLQEIARLRTRIRKQRPKSLLFPKRQRPDVIPRPPRVDRVELVQRGSSEDV